MITDDPVLPAAAHLTGPRAGSVLGPAVAATGRELAWCRPIQVQYRPGSDLVVRFRAGIRSGRRTTVDTLLAATTAAGPPPGTLHVEAERQDGPPLQVGVWRWPFDPVLTALDRIVTPDRARDLLGDLVGARPVPSVVAYRPTERAVVRLDPGDGRPAFYVKVVAPDVADLLVDRHQRLHLAGLPVPRILAADPEWIAMEAILGPTLRDRVKSGAGPWPTSRELAAVLTRFSAVDGTGLAPARSRIADAPAHAEMLATVLPCERNRLERIAARIDERLRGGAADRRVRAVIHGDLHEAQLVVDGRRVAGLLDVDDVGIGDPLDDVATLVGHLVYRATTAVHHGPRILRYATRLESELVHDGDARDLDVFVAATLVGLATGPFRIQQPNWGAITTSQLDHVERLLDRPGDGSRPR